MKRSRGKPSRRDRKAGRERAERAGRHGLPVREGSTPALVVDGKVVAAGRVLDAGQIRILLTGS